VSIDNELISAARAALGETDGETAERLYDELIASIEAKHAGNQREVAATLGSVAKALDAEDSPEKAMQFKQRTTEIMLKRSMSARMAQRELPRMQNQPTMQSSVQLPFGKLEYLYIGCADFDRDLTYYTEVLGAQLLWAFDSLDARVAALRLAAGAPLLLSTHRQAPSCQPIFSVASLDTAVKTLMARGWTSQGDAVETPNGTAYLFVDPSGNQFAILQNDRPDAMEKAYADESNPNAIRI
jgi:predicted enzyme related to lactoylglutathione lyase